MNERSVIVNCSVQRLCQNSVKGLFLSLLGKGSEDRFNGVLILGETGTRKEWILQRRAAVVEILRRGSAISIVVFWRLAVLYRDRNTDYEHQGRILERRIQTS